MLLVTMKFDRKLWTCTKKVLMREKENIEKEFNEIINDERIIRQFLELQNHLVRGKTTKAHVDYILYLVEVKDKKQADEDRKEERKQVKKDILDEIEKRYVFATPTDTEELLLYDDGVYIIAKTIIKGRVERILKDSASIGFCNEIVDHFRRRSYIDREEINKTVDYLPLANGLLNLNTLELEAHDPYKIFTFKLPTIYTPDAKCPKFLKAFNQIIIEKDDRLLLQEWAGYTLLPAFPHHHLMFLVGGGRNGKGTFIRTVEGIIGRRNVSNIKLEDFSGSRRFVLARIYGMLMNVCSEPRTRFELETEIIKMVTGDDTIDAELKNIQKPLKFTSFAKFYVQANRLPRVADTTESWWDRVLIIRFDQKFTYEKGNRVPEIEDIWLNDEEERSGVLNWMLVGLRRLMDNQEFTISKTMKEQMILFKQLSDTVGAFLEDESVIKYSSILFTTGEVLYDGYKAYVENINGIIESVRVFNARLRLMPNIVSSQPRGEDGKPHRGWKGIGLLSSKERDGTETLETPETLSIPPATESKKTAANNKENNKGGITRVSGVSGVSPVDSFFEGHDQEKPPRLLKQLIKMWLRYERKLNMGFKPKTDKDLTLISKGHDSKLVEERSGNFYWFSKAAKKMIKRWEL